MKLPIDIASGPPSWKAINDLRDARKILAKKFSSLGAWAGVLALVSAVIGEGYKVEWMLYVFVVSLVIFGVSTQYERGMLRKDMLVFGEVPAELCAQLYIYCQSTPDATAYKEAVIKERRAFIMAEYNALRDHARAAGSDEGVSALYSSKG